MPRWIVAMEAMVYEEVDAATADDASEEAIARYEDEDHIEIACIVDMDILIGEGDDGQSILRKRIVEEEWW